MRPRPDRERRSRLDASRRTRTSGCRPARGGRAPRQIRARSERSYQTANGACVATRLPPEASDSSTASIIRTTSSPTSREERGVLPSRIAAAEVVELERERLRHRHLRRDDVARPVGEPVLPERLRVLDHHARVEDADGLVGRVVVDDHLLASRRSSCGGACWGRATRARRGAIGPDANSRLMNATSGVSGMTQLAARSRETCDGVSSSQ